MDSQVGGGSGLRMSTDEKTTIGVVEETIEGQVEGNALQVEPTPVKDDNPGQPKEVDAMTDRLRRSTVLLVTSMIVGFIGVGVAVSPFYRSLPTTLRTSMLIVLSLAAIGAFYSLVLCFSEYDDLSNAQSDGDDDTDE